MVEPSCWTSKARQRLLTSFSTSFFRIPLALRPVSKNQHASKLDVCEDVAALRDENVTDTRKSLNPPQLRSDTPEAELESLVAYIEWLIAHDRKSTSLKSLQGKIWQEGYRSGQLYGQVFEDVPRALNRWQEQKRNVCIFSSGSVLAQRLLLRTLWREI
jgi:enolase-phosphatase E1